MNLDLHRSIFPLYSMKKNGKVYDDGDLLGTCFLARVSDFIVLITAKHVFDNYEKTTCDLLIYYNNGEGEPTPLLLEAIITNNNLSDFAFILPLGKTFEIIIETFLPIQISYNRLRLGDRILSFGYPLSSKERNFENKIELFINPMFFEGYIHSIWSNVPNLKFSTVYTLSFPSLPGLSGGPLLKIVEGNLKVVGLMHENRMLNRVLIEKNEFEEDETKIIEKNYLAYEMGIASDYLPFEELKAYLIERQKGLGLPKL